MSWLCKSALLSAGLATLAGCDSAGGDVVATAESCMTCHNGSQANDYAGPGIENPHPFPGAAVVLCTTCHGGNAGGGDKLASHVPPPPQIGDRQQWINDARAYFNRLTLAGMDKFADYQVNGVTYSAIDYLQFINPGDLRVVTQNRSCGVCHAPHAELVSRSPLATETGIFSGAMYAIGAENHIPAHRGLFEDTASDLGFRAVSVPGFVHDPNDVGAIGQLLEQPVYSVRNRPGSIHNNPAYDVPALADDLNPDNTVVSDSPLAHLFHEQIAFTCGDCHLGSAGANNRAGDFRSSGCTACHMPYSLGGRAGSSDPNISKTEPVDPDDIDEPELAHTRGHRIRSVRQTLANGQVVDGIDDHTCAGCHQGSNRTVMQYWGIRLDQNQDVRRGVQYPANPASFQTTQNDPRLFDPAVGNQTFNGRNHNQYLRFEDYDGDGRDDTPADVHYEAGLGCIDCHGTHDVHAGDATNPEAKIMSRMEQVVSIQCENCHGAAAAYASTAAGIAHNGQPAQLAVDANGNVLPHVVLEGDGNYYLYGKLTGNRHFVPQTRDTVVDTGKLNPFTQQAVYSQRASYAMGRWDNDPATGIGPQQTGGTPNGFSHGDNMNCVSCHAAWTNTCVGCHLKGEYDNGNNFSNITGERIVFKQANADFTYQTPVPFQLGINAHNKITQVAANTKVFFQWIDRNQTASQIYAFTDRKGNGNNPATPFPSLGHNALMAHSVRGRVTATNEGPRYCVACHLTTAGLAQYQNEYTAFRTAMANNNFGALDFTLLQQHIGRNPGNRLNSPIWVHMVAGLGSGVFAFDQNGAPVNPLDDDPNRVGAGGIAPSTVFDPARVRLNLDRIVNDAGTETGSNNHMLLNGPPVPNLRGGGTYPNMAGPLGMALIQRLVDPATGIVLDSWLDAQGAPQGGAPTWVQ